MLQCGFVSIVPGMTHSTLQRMANGRSVRRTVGQNRKQSDGKQHREGGREGGWREEGRGETDREADNL